MRSLFILFICFIAFLSVIYFVNEDVEPQSEVLYSSLEIPQLQTERTEQIIYHEGFTISYNSDYKIANWVTYELTPEKAGSNKVQRYDLFLPDPKVKGASATDYDYRGSGYDRGHLVPAGDMKWSEEAMKATFYFSNICPQNRGLNNGVWHDLEKRCRRWAAKKDRLLITAGPVLGNNLDCIGNNCVAVPKYFYKVIYSVSDNNVEGLGFLFENKNYTKTSLASLAVPIDSIERVTGLDFFPSLPVDIQNKIESSVYLEAWGLK